MKTCVEHIIALTFKLNILGMPINGATDILCDDENVVNNSSKKELCIKKYSSIVYHVVRWAVATGIVKVDWINTNKNLAYAA